MPTFSPARYDRMIYRRCGRWGVKLPVISLGAWQTYGGYVSDEVSRQCLFRAFDLGINHFDFANNYGEPSGNAETICGAIIAEMPREELLISTKAGFRMWPGPYGEWLSRKYLLSSLDQSLRRLRLDHVDLFYAHRPDPDTPTDEVMDALDQAVRQGKALYTGLSNHAADDIRAKNAHAIAYHTARPIICQSSYNMLFRGVEQAVLPACAECGMGFIAFCPLAQGSLAGRYLGAAPPADSRLARSTDVCAKVLGKPEEARLVSRLNEIASRRGQTLPQMAISWILRRPEVTSIVMGASRPGQIEENVAALDKLEFAADELTEMSTALAVR